MLGQLSTLTNSNYDVGKCLKCLISEDDCLNSLNNSRKSRSRFLIRANFPWFHNDATPLIRDLSC